MTGALPAGAGPPRNRTEARPSSARFFGLALALGVLGFELGRPWFSAVLVLHGLSQPAVATPLGTPALERDFIGDFGGRWTRARLYSTSGRIRRCVVLGHGVHYEGMDEPRLERFAVALANAGALVSTPELVDLADYRITASGRDVLADAVLDLHSRCASAGAGKVGLVGFSFAGGLSLLAAADPKVEPHLAYVASVGGYDDLGRVLEFLLTDKVTSPSGVSPRKAHEYGAVVLLYEHLDAFVPDVDRPAMARSIRAWLMEDRSSAWLFASQRTTEAAEALFVALESGRLSAVRDRLRAIVGGDSADVEALSPRGRLRALRIPVYLLHGSGDSVIPPEETLWADRELTGRPHRALVTPLLEHVELGRSAGIGDALRLIDFVAALL